MSRYFHKIESATSGRADTTGLDPASERFQLDYATWYARIAAPGSRIRRTPSKMRPIVHLETIARPAQAEGFERQIA
jgi:hypothetical protein